MWVWGIIHGIEQTKLQRHAEVLLIPWSLHMVGIQVMAFSVLTALQAPSNKRIDRQHNLKFVEQESMTLKTL
jgi:hypothetical protein